MNRFQRRTQKSTPDTPAELLPALLFRCPGVHGAGCPDKAMLAFLVGHKPEQGISVDKLHDLTKSSGWALAAGKIPNVDGTTTVTLEPLCGTCEEKLVQEMVDSMGGNVAPNAQAYVTKVLGSS